MIGDVFESLSEQCMAVGQAGEGGGGVVATDGSVDRWAGSRWQTTVVEC